MSVAYKINILTRHEIFELRYRENCHCMYIVNVEAKAHDINYFCSCALNHDKKYINMLTCVHISALKARRHCF